MIFFLYVDNLGLTLLSNMTEPEAAEIISVHKSALSSCAYMHIPQCIDTHIQCLNVT